LADRREERGPGIVDFKRYASANRREERGPGLIGAERFALADRRKEGRPGLIVTIKRLAFRLQMQQFKCVTYS